MRATMHPAGRSLRPDRAPRIPVGKKSLRVLIPLLLGGLLAGGVTGCSKKESAIPDAPSSGASGIIPKDAEEEIAPEIIPPFSPFGQFENASRLASLDRSPLAAVSQLEGVIQRCPNSALSLAAHLRMGQIYAGYLQNYQKAVDSYQRVVDQQPQSLWAAHALFEIANLKVSKLQKYQEGIHIFGEIISRFSDKREWAAAAALSIGQTYLYYLNDRKAALKYFDRTIQLFPGSPFAQTAKTLKSRPPLTAEWLFRECLYMRREACDQLAANFPDSDRVSQVPFWSGVLHFGQLDFQKAAEIFQTYLASGVDSKFRDYARFFSGMSYLYRGEYDRALEQLLAARENLKNVWDLPGRLIYQFYGDTANSYDGDKLSLYQGLIEFEIGDIYARLKNDPARAREHYQKAEDFIGKQARSLLMLRLAQAYAYQLGDAAKALDLFDRIKTSRGYFFCYSQPCEFEWLRRDSDYEIGGLYYTGGEREKALEAFETLLKTKSHDSFAQLARLAKGFIFYREGNLTAARAEWQEVGNDAPERKTADLLLALFSPDSSYALVERGRFDNEIGFEIYQHPAGEKIVLILKNGLPLTYITGKAEMKNGILKAEYEQGFTVEFYNPGVFIMFNNLILEGMAEIPPGFLRNSRIIFPPLGHIIASGEFVDKPAVLLYFTEGLRAQILLHELIHYHDLASTGSWFDPFDPSILFKRISYYQLGQDYWPRWRDYRSFSYSDDRGLFSPEEDLATLGVDYFEKGSRFRKQARKQMQRGDFSMAAKYLFIRYLTPFEGREYDLSERNSSLGFEEVEEALARARSTHRRTDQTTVDIIQEIKERWLRGSTEFTCQDTVEW